MTQSTGSNHPRRIGVFGGSFDPVHFGHVVAAKAVSEALNLDLLLFVPAGDQWQKTGQTLAHHRLQMVQLAIDGIPGFEVSTVDVDRPGATYTFDTLSQLGATYPDAELFFILGTDALAGIESWHKADETLGLAQFVVVTRPGSPVQIPNLAKGRVQVVNIPALDISSTNFRNLATAGGDVSGLVPASVLRYIEENNLYGMGK